ncbi:hypothetical protein ACHAP7_011831 [Fusarium lateritium]
MSNQPRSDVQQPDGTTLPSSKPLIKPDPDNSAPIRAMSPNTPVPSIEIPDVPDMTDNTSASRPLSQSVSPSVDLTITRIHECNVSSPSEGVELYVSWDDGLDEWVTETEVQDRNRGGRNAATQLDVFHVYAIIDERKSGRGNLYLCQWVGYAADDEENLSWEPASKVKRIARNAYYEWIAAK